LNYKYLITSIRSTCLTKWRQSQCIMGNISHGKPSILTKNNPDVRHFLCANIYIVWPATVHVVYGEYLMYRGAVVVLIVWWLDLQLPIQSVPISTKIMCSNSAHYDVYLKQLYVRKFVNDLPQVGASSTNKTDCNDITEILLKEASNTIAHTRRSHWSKSYYSWKWG
jgi:hypothetical protein